mgnify:CR=1 FL=1
MIAAMEAGAWVLCEKPFCGSLAELDDIEAAEKRTGRHAACVFQMRFASSTARVASSSVELAVSSSSVITTPWEPDRIASNSCSPAASPSP